MKDSANYRYLCRLFGPLTAPVSKMCKTKQHVSKGKALPGRFVWPWVIILGGSIHAVNPQVSIADDLRRDATVRAVEEAMPCVVNIRTEIMVERRDFYYDLLWDFFGPYYRQRPSESTYSLGSGVIVHESGYVLTNAHVINRASRIQVVLHDGSVYEAEMVAGIAASDVAVLKISPIAPAMRFRAIQFAKDDDLLLGESVLALGNPFGLGSSVSRGILSSKNRRPPTEDQPLDVDHWLQTDAAINPGNSGGPLVNLEGRLMGLNVAVYKEAQGIGFAIPIKQVNEALTEMLSVERITGLWFGAKVDASVHPPRLLEVHPESPAYQAGLRKKDQLLALDGQTLDGIFDWIKGVANVPPDQELSLRVQRGDEEFTQSLKLPPEETFFNADLIQGLIGIRLQPVTPQLARHVGLDRIQGLLVADIVPEGPAYSSGIRPGCVLIECQDQPVEDILSLARQIHGMKRGSEIQLTVLVQRRFGRLATFGRATASLRLP